MPSCAATQGGVRLPHWTAVFALAAVQVAVSRAEESPAPRLIRTVPHAAGHATMPSDTRLRERTGALGSIPVSASRGWPAAAGRLVEVAISDRGRAMFAGGFPESLLLDGDEAHPHPLDRGALVSQESSTTSAPVPAPETSSSTRAPQSVSSSTDDVSGDAHEAGHIGHQARGNHRHLGAHSGGAAGVKSGVDGTAQVLKNQSSHDAGSKSVSKSHSRFAAGYRAEAMTTASLTRVFFVIVPVAIASCVAFEAVHRNWAAIDLSEPVEELQEGAPAGRGMRVSRWLDGVWPLSKQFFFEGPQQGLAKLMFSLLVMAALFRLFLSWCRNQWQRDFWDSIQRRQTHEFWNAMFLFVLLAIVNVLTSTYQSYLQSILSIRWRACLTKQLQERWLIGRAFYMQHFPRTDEEDDPTVMDNPDQRLQEDISGFVGGVLGLFFGLLASVGGLLVFTPVLFSLSPPYAFGVFYCPGWLLYVTLIYSILGSCFTHLIGRYLLPINFIKQKREADYRHTAMEVKDNSESIAMYGSEAVESRRLERSFDRIQRIAWEEMKYSKHLGFFLNFYYLANDVVPFCILAGNYFKGQITLGQMMQILGALGQVQDALNGFVDAYPMITSARATIDRLYGFWQAVDKGQRSVSSCTVNKEALRPGEPLALNVQDLRVELPGQRILWDGARLLVKPGERVLLLGRDGSGKSVFLRALAGCWPATGTVRLGRNDVLFVPQRPFVPAGTLLEAVSYPEGPERYGEQPAREALQAVGLTSLEAVPLDEHTDWQKRLSGGEQQRLAFAHALLRRPSLLVLDETTSAIGDSQAAELYALLADRLPPTTAVITIDHEANVGSLSKWHTSRYTCDSKPGSWAPA